PSRLIPGHLGERVETLGTKFGLVDEPADGLPARQVLGESWVRRRVLRGTGQTGQVTYGRGDLGPIFQGLAGKQILITERAQGLERGFEVAFRHCGYDRSQAAVD